MDKGTRITTCITMILVCITAILWNYNVFVSWANGYPNVLYIISAILFDGAAVRWVRFYLKSRKNTS